MLECIAIITKNQGSLSTVVGDEKLTSREGRIGPLFMHVQSDEDTLLKVDEVSKTEAQAFDVFDQPISRFKFRV
jgi:D-lyxose ketol-isomerase